MSPSRRPLARAGGPAAAGLLLAVVALAFGILGMHALGTHGLAVPPAGTAGAASSVTAHEAPGGHDQHDGQGSHGGHAMDGMTALCLAVLVLGLGLALLRGRPGQVAVAERRVPLASRRAAAGRRDSGPPTVWEFSVLRC